MDLGELAVLVRLKGVRSRRQQLTQVTVERDQHLRGERHAARAADVDARPRRCTGGIAEVVERSRAAVPHRFAFVCGGNVHAVGGAGGRADVVETRVGVDLGAGEAQTERRIVGGEQPGKDIVETQRSSGGDGDWRHCGIEVGLTHLEQCNRDGGIARSAVEQVHVAAPLRAAQADGVRRSVDEKIVRPRREREQVAEEPVVAVADRAVSSSGVGDDVDVGEEDRAAGSPFPDHHHRAFEG